MARTFNGTSDVLQFSLGAVPALATTSFACILRRTATGKVGFCDMINAGSSIWSFFVAASGGGSSNKLSLWNGSATVSPVTTLTGSEGWVFVGFNKATGSAIPRYHKYVYSTDTWTHATSSAISNSGAAAGNFYVANSNGASVLTGDYAIGAVYNVELSDAQFEAMAYSLSAWWAVQPKGLWILDQDAVGQKVFDQSGNGANESSRTGTSVATTAVPVFTYGHPLARMVRG